MSHLLIIQTVNFPYFLCFPLLQFVIQSFFFRIYQDEKNSFYHRDKNQIGQNHFPLVPLGLGSLLAGTFAGIAAGIATYLPITNLVRITISYSSHFSLFFFRGHS